MMYDIQLKALSMYEKNLAYFAQKDKKLFQKIQIFDMPDIEQKYDLEYIQDGNYFDVKEVSSNLFLYNTNSNVYGKNCADNIDYKKNSFTFEGLIDYIASKEQIEKVKSQTNFTHSTIKDVLPIMNYTRKVVPKISTTMKAIDKFIFIGTGLGTQISTVDAKIKSSEYLIIEDDLELFRLSLFITPYYEIANHTNLHFAIAQNDTDFIVTMARFLEGSFFNNRYLKYFLFPAHSNKKIKLIQNNLASQTHLIFPYDIQLDKFLKPLNRIKNGYKVLNLSQKFQNTVFSEKPALVLAAGPSLKQNIEWLKHNHNRFIIIAVSSVLKILFQNSIKPDIVTHIDGITTEGNSCMVHFEGLDVGEFLKECLFIFGSHTPQQLVDMLNKEHIYFFESYTFYYDDFGSLSTPCVGSTSVVLSLWLNFKEIYMLGIDLALDPQTGATHSSDHHYNDTHNLTQSDEIDTVISLRKNLIPIKGNFEKTVYTTPLFLASIHSLNNNISALKDDTQTIYNLNNGAFFELSIPAKSDTIDADKYIVIDKTAIKNKIFDTLEKYSRASLNIKEIESLKRRVYNAKIVLSFIEDYSKKSFTDDDKYLYDLLGVVSDILKLQGVEANNLTLVFASYFQYVLPYIVDMLNTKEVTKIMKHIKIIDAMFIEGCLSIVNKYIDEFEDFLDT